MNAIESNIAAFIDMDYTLYKKYLWQALFAHHKQNHFKRRSVYLFVAYHFPLWMLVKARLLSRKFFYRHNATNLAWLLRGVSIDRAETIWDWIIENEIMPHLRPEMVTAFENHKNLGHRLFLISGSFTPLLDKLAIHLGIEGAIATPLDARDGRYTGRIVHPLNVGKGKVKRLKRFLDEAGREIDLAASYFYTDSFVDAPVMEMFGHPIAVYPDPELASLATTHGWQVIGDDHFTESTS